MTTGTIDPHLQPAPPQTFVLFTSWFNQNKRKQNFHWIQSNIKRAFWNKNSTVHVKLIDVEIIKQCWKHARTRSWGPGTLESVSVLRRFVVWFMTLTLLVLGSLTCFHRWGWVELTGLQQKHIACLFSLSVCLWEGAHRHRELLSRRWMFVFVVLWIINDLQASATSHTFNFPKQQEPVPPLHTGHEESVWSCWAAAV